LWFPTLESKNDSRMEAPGTRLQMQEGPSRGAGWPLVIRSCLVYLKEAMALASSSLMSKTV